MEKNERLEIFARYLDMNFYFTSDTLEKKNKYEWNADRSTVTVYNDDWSSIGGVGDIGQMAAALDLCCSVYFSTYDRRVEIRVH